MSGTQTQTTHLTTEPRIGRSVSLDDAAMLLGVSRRTIYNRIRDGRLQTIRTPGGSQRVLLMSMRQPETLGPWRQAAPMTPRPETARGTSTSNA